MSCGVKIPWWAKIAGKIILSRTPVPYSAWRRLSLFRAGGMDNVSRARKVYDSFIATYETYQRLPENFGFLEIGPGDSVLTALFARTAGCGNCYLSDAADLASSDIGLYQEAANLLIAEGLPAPDLSAARTRSDILEACGAEYLTDGLNDLKKIPSDSIDVCGSQAVLEHIRLHDFRETFEEIFRISRTGAVHLHVVDFQDHLDWSLNNLRFSPKVWESDFFSSSGFYTNRISFSQMAETFKEVGFEIVVQERTVCWDQLPLDRKAFHNSFEIMEESDLLVRVGTFHLRKGGIAI